MNHPFMRRYLALPGSPLFLLLLSLSLLATFALGIKLTEIGQALRPYDIVSLELAWTPEKARAILSEERPDGTVAEWKQEKVDAARQSLLWDFPFLLSYAPLISALVLLAARQMPGLTRLNALLCLAPFVAAGLDTLENLALLRVLALIPTPSGFLLQVAAMAAGAKFALLVPSALYAPAVGIYRLLNPTTTTD